MAETKLLSLGWETGQKAIWWKLDLTRMDRRTSSKFFSDLSHAYTVHAEMGATIIRHVKRHTWKHFSPIFHNQTNCNRSRGLTDSPLLDKRVVNHHRGSGGWSKLKARHNEISLSSPSLSLTHTYRRNAWLINAKKHVTLNWWSEIKRNKEKKKKLQQTKNATNVNVCSHGYWAGQCGTEHEEESLIQTEVHFTVVLALRGRNWEPFHDQRRLALGHKCLWSNARLKAMT